MYGDSKLIPIIGSITCIVLIGQIYIAWANSLGSGLEVNFNESQRKNQIKQYWSGQSTPTNTRWCAYTPIDDKTTAKEIRKKMVLRKNIIGTQVISQTTAVTEIAKPLEIDNTKKNKPTVDMKKPSVVEQMTPTRNGKDIILMENECKITPEREKVYKALIEAINSDKDLNPSDRYTLLQCVMYVDVYPKAVLIFIDKPLLMARQVTEDRLHKDLMIANIRKAFNDPNLHVEFDDYVLPSMLNYYLGIRTNG